MFIEKIFLILVLLTPLVVVPQMQLGWEVGKVFWLWTVIEAWVVYRIVSGKTIWRSNSIWYAGLFWLVVMLVSSQINQGEAFWGGWWRRQGWWFMAHLALLSSLVATTSVTKKWIGKLLLTSGLATLAVGALLLNRTTGSIYEANNVGLASTLVIILAASYKKIGVGVLAGVGLVLSQSRAAIVGCLVLVRRFPNKIIFIGTILLLAVFAWSTWGRGTGERWQVWQDSLRVWTYSPWMGIGLDNYYASYTQLMKEQGIELVRFDQPHNLILWLLISVGSIGTASFLGWLYLIFASSKGKIWKDLALAIIIFGLFQPLSTTAWVYLFVILGASVCEN